MDYSLVEAASQIGIAPATLRKWSTQLAPLLSKPGGQLGATYMGAAQRSYTENDIVVLRQAKALLSSGYTYEQVRQQLANELPKHQERSSGLPEAPAILEGLRRPKLVPVEVGRVPQHEERKYTASVRYSVAETARRLKISESGVHKWIKAGKLTAEYDGTQWHVLLPQGAVPDLDESVEPQLARSPFYPTSAQNELPASIGSTSQLPPLPTFDSGAASSEPQANAFDSQSKSRRSYTQLWAYLLLLASAEIYISYVSVQVGAVLYAVLLLGFATRGVVGISTSNRRVALSLTLIPLLRLLWLSLPLTTFVPLLWYALASTPLLLACWVIARHLRLSLHDLGLHLNAPFLQLALMGSGLGLGAFQYAFLPSTLPLATPSWNKLLVIVLLFFTGFTEELIYRGVILATASPALRNRVCLFAALLFVVPQIGSFSILHVTFVFGIGLVFAYTRYLTGSILGVVLAHSMASVTSLLIMPYLSAYPSNPLSTVVYPIVWVGTVLSLLAIAFLIWQGKNVQQPV